MYSLTVLRLLPIGSTVFLQSCLQTVNSDCYQLVAVVSVQGVTVHIIIYIIIQDKVDKVLRSNNKALVVMARDKRKAHGNAGKKRGIKATAAALAAPAKKKMKKQSAGVQQGSEPVARPTLVRLLRERRRQITATPISRTFVSFPYGRSPHYTSCVFIYTTCKVLGLCKR